MKIQTMKHSLNRAVTNLQGALADRSLAQIGIRADAQKITLSASDMILSYFAEIECEVMEGGECFVPARLFSEVIRELPEGLVRFEVKDQNLEIVAGIEETFLMRIPRIADLHWQEPPKIDVVETAELETRKLLHMIEQVQFCIVQDSPRNFGSVGFLHSIPAAEGAKNESDSQNSARGGILRLVGSDGFRLSYCQSQHEGLDDQFLTQGLCLTKRTLNELAKLCRTDEVDRIRLGISQDRSTLTADLPNFRAFFRLSAVKYPNYKNVIAGKKSNEILLDRRKLHEGLKRIMLAADKSRSIKMLFQPGALELVAKTAGSSEGRERIAIDSKVEGLTLSLNGKYLADVISTTSSLSLKMGFQDEDSPILILPSEEPDGCESLHLFLPIKESS